MTTARGFTIVELIITITVMSILMTLAVVNLRSTQVQARDTERASDIDAMAKRLDSLYTRGFTPESDVVGSAIRGSYPPTAWMKDDAPNTRAKLFNELPPGVMIDPSQDSAAGSIGVATNTSTGTTIGSGAVAPFPSSDNPYVYQPIADDGSLCDSTAKTCRKFNLYAWVEATPDTAIKIESRYR